jgi:hypothetical protein
VSDRFSLCGHISILGFLSLWTVLVMVLVSLRSVLCVLSGTKRSSR